MKKFTILFLFVSLTMTVFAAKHTITNSGTTFSPSTKTINQGDTVIFQLGGSHNVIEVSQATFNAGGNTSNGGFSLGFGGGTIVLANAGTYYYVCEPHAAMGMKGIITVTPTSGVSELKTNVFNAVYPNPAKNYVMVSFYLNKKSSISYSIYDLAGKEVYLTTKVAQSPGDVKEKIEPKNRLTAGSYFIRARFDDGSEIKGKFMIQ